MTSTSPPAKPRSTPVPKNPSSDAWKRAREPFKWPSNYEKFDMGAFIRDDRATDAPLPPSIGLPPLVDVPRMLRREARATGDAEERRIFERTVEQFTPVVAATTLAAFGGAVYVLRGWRWKSRSLVSVGSALAGHWAGVLAQEFVILYRLRELPEPSPPPPPPPPAPKRMRWWA